MSIENKKDYYEAYYNLGNLYQYHLENMYTEAEYQYIKAKEYNNNYFDAMF